MPRNEKAATAGEAKNDGGTAPRKPKTAAPKKPKPVAPGAARSAQTGKEATKTKVLKAIEPKAKRAAKTLKTAASVQEQLLSSEVVFEGPLFRVLHDKLIEPGGRESERDVIRHNGSVVILAMDSSKDKKNPWIVVERQYRHAARQYLWELPAGKLEPGEDALAGAKRELAEETGYGAKRWKLLAEYYPSPGFLGESMKIFVAEGLVAGDAHPEDDEQIEFRLVKLSEALKMIEKGAILDGKTLSGVLLYARLSARKHKM